MTKSCCENFKIEYQNYFIKITKKVFIGLLSTVIVYPFVILIELWFRNARKWNRNIFYIGRTKQNAKINIFVALIFSLCILCMILSTLFVLIKGNQFTSAEVYYPNIYSPFEG